MEAELRRTWKRTVDAAELAQVITDRKVRQLLRGVRREPEPTPWIRAALLGAGTGLAVGTALAGIMSSASAYLARVVVTPVHDETEDLEVLAVIEDSDGLQVILPVTADTVVEGTYGLHFDRGSSVAQIGEITSLEPKHGTVTRRVLGVNGGDLRKTRSAFISSALYRNPAEAGFDYSEVTLNLPVGEAPAWYVPNHNPKGPLAGKNVWGVMVHGRTGTRVEGIKALNTARRLGMESLLVSYRNDGVAPAGPDGLYGLGGTEWEDVEVAVQYALDHGAGDVVLFGWSMGGAVALQTADQSPLSPRIRGMVLTGPVIDWIDVLSHQARARRVPEPVGKLAQWLLSNDAGRTVTGLAAPLDLKALNWIARSDQLHTRSLILHSVDDEVVPYQPSRELAERNRLVSFVPFHRARHVKEWNCDPERWESAVYEWATDLFSAPLPGQSP
ncbi:alpha/beta hydrolase family protein [Nesterenkonia haasae]|uniref:alpha/beta hydrolase family protein n=1 Tax=Nesterenkonia haasae TaxID=2587813 RepID=UPI001290D5E8|nr:alpha/beta fold hydrolase [Nesterenkonia haasae]NDK30414.1 alpha/beta hydrolase [Nesterenkonia haasae]